MDDQQSGDGQRRDAPLQRLLKTLPVSREETAEAVRRAKGKRARTQPGPASRKRLAAE